MLKCLPVVLLTLMIFSCRDKKPSLAGEEKVEQSAFFDAFPTLKLPFNIVDTNINNLGDTTVISHSVFTEFVPDTVFKSTFPDQKNLVIHPIGKYPVKGKETYVAATVLNKRKSAVYLFVFDKNRKFSAAMPLLQSGTEANTNYSASIDNKLAISLNKTWKTEDELLYSRIIYAYNNAGMFTVVLTETNDQSGLSNKLNNPLDTLPANNKYSGDYFKGEQSIVSIRDGKTPDSYLIFVHFENETGNDESCNGEVKGSFVMNSPTTGVFSENNDPCVIDLTFTNKTVKVKEQGNCGSHRGITCFFNDTYTRKSSQKSSKKK